MSSIICRIAASVMLLALPVWLFSSPSVAAQERTPVSVEVRGAYTFPVGTFSSDVGAQSDLGWGAGAILGVSPWFGIYGGWSEDVFHCEGCTSNQEVRASGVEVGGRFNLPSRTRLQPWVRAGVLSPQSTIRYGNSQFESSRHLGFQAAAGVDAPVGEMLSVSPSVRFNSFTSEFEGVEGVPGFDRRTEFRYLTFDLAARIHLR